MFSSKFAVFLIMNSMDVVDFDLSRDHGRGNAISINVYKNVK